MSVLPSELYREILRWLRQKPLFKCKRVCRTWRDTLVNECVTRLKITKYGYRHDLSNPLSTTFVNLRALFIDHRACYGNNNNYYTCDKDVRYLTALTTLNLFDTRHSFSDEAITLLTNLTKLNCGRGSHITDGGIRELTKLRSLKCGYGCLVSDDGFSTLTNLEKLASKRGIPLTYHSAPYLTKLRSLNCGFDGTLSAGPLLHFLTNLSSLSLADNQRVNDEDIISLDSLTSLNLSCNDRITDECLRCLTNLRALNIDNSRLISDVGIRDLTNLTKLNIGGNMGISDEGVRSLTNLTKLDFSFCHSLITESGLSHLTKREDRELYQGRLKESALTQQPIALQDKVFTRNEIITFIFIAVAIHWLICLCGHVFATK